MWTSPQYNNVEKGDEKFAIWHLPYEKKRGLYYLFKMLRRTNSIKDEAAFWRKAAFYTGIPTVNLGKKIKDFRTAIIRKIIH